jgi:hypothetical protein
MSDTSDLVRRLIEANENSQQSAMGSDIFYLAAERIDHLEKEADLRETPWRLTLDESPKINRLLLCYWPNETATHLGFGIAHFNGREWISNTHSGAPDKWMEIPE